MKVDLKNLSDIKKEIHVTVPTDRVRQELDQAYRRIGMKANLKGFRPGKVPRSVLEQHYRQDAEGEAIDNLIRQSYPEAILSTGLLPVTPPEVHVADFGPAQDLIYHASFEIKPSIEVKGYLGMKLQKDKIEVTDQEMADNLGALQERMAQLIPIVENRKPRAGDVVVIDGRGFEGGKPLPEFKGEGAFVELGRDQLLPALEETLFQMSIGEIKKTRVTLPPPSPDKKGREIDYEICLKEMKKKKLTELNDEFARDVGPFENLEALKSKIREGIVQSKEQAARNKLRRQVIEKLIQENGFSAPEGLVNAELEEMWRHLEANLKSQGLTPEQAAIDREKFFEQYREEAVIRVKGWILFDSIGGKEGISVTPEEVDNPAIFEEKTLDFVLSKSTIDKG